jgi:hypothetical protein
MIIKINSSYLSYNDIAWYVNDYHQYIINLIKEILKNKEININIIFCGADHDFDNNNKIIRINFNYEHTLVKIGGRDTGNALTGNIKDDDGNNYLVRIDRYDQLLNSDIIIDYSIPNICNVINSNLYHDFAQKHIYIAPSFYHNNLYFVKENRNISTLTTFINIYEPRRFTLLEKINKYDIHHVNVNNCFNKDDLQNLYKNTKILINIHQTDHHHTFEELRVLPALQCGVIVVSEKSPLSHLVPYNDYVIWSSYDNIVDKVIEIINNYDHFFDLIFKNNKKDIKFNNLHDINYEKLNNLL